MKAVLFRTGSGSTPVQTPPVPGSPRLSINLPRQQSFERNIVSSPRISLHSDAGMRRGIRRSSSESDVVIRSELKGLTRLQGSRSFPAMIPEEQEERLGSLTLTRDQLGFGGSGMDKNGFSRSGGGGGGGRGGDDKIGAYYQEMLSSDPTNALLLANYAKYLHEVERDMVKAEEYYGRAILASRGDGEVLSSYGKLIWEAYADKLRAKSYFQQALHVSPHDCTILGSYAQFLWEAEVEDDDDDEQDQEIEGANADEVASTAVMVEAF